MKEYLLPIFSPSRVFSIYINVILPPKRMAYKDESAGILLFGRRMIYTSFTKSEAGFCPES